MIYVFLAHGFEEIEAITVIDVLRRGNLEVETVGIGAKTITGAHGITLHCDIHDRQINNKKITAIVLPGGMPGTDNLEKSPVVQAAIDHCSESGLLIAAICAAPKILGKKGLLNGKKATVYPSYIANLEGADYTDQPVVTDGTIITGNGPASALLFSLKVLEYLVSPELAKEIGASMQCPKD